MDDALLTALCMLGFAMLLGTWKPQQPWRWVVLVWIGVPMVMAYYAYIVKWPHDRGQVYGAFLQILAASAGGFGGHFMRQMIDNVFRGKDGRDRVALTYSISVNLHFAPPKQTGDG